jgi:hypothetical protein
MVISIFLNKGQYYMTIFGKGKKAQIKFTLQAVILPKNNPIQPSCQAKKRHIFSLYQESHRVSLTETPSLHWKAHYI